MSAEHGLTNIIALCEQQTITATGAQSGVDVSAVRGNAIVIIGGSAVGSSATQTYKLQGCATQGGAYADTGYAFAVTTVAEETAAWSRAITVNFDGLPKFMNIYCTETGTSSSVVSAYILHRAT